MERPNVSDFVRVNKLVGVLLRNRLTVVYMTQEMRNHWH
jgi:hypothetical protein